MASVERLKHGWRVSYREGGRGSKLIRLSGFPTKADAIEAKQRIEAKLAAAGKVVAGAQISLEELLLRWERAKLSGKQPNDRHSTVTAVRRMRRHIELMGWTSTDQITSAEVQRWRETLDQTTRVGSYLHALLTFGRDILDQVVEHKALISLKPPRSRRKAPRPLLSIDRVAEAYRLAVEWGPSTAALVHCLTVYAWRPITAARLSVGDLVGDRITTKVKGHHEVNHPLLPATLELLRPLCESRGPRDPLFVDPRSGRRFEEHDTYTIPQFCRDHLGLQSYDLKRFAASHLLPAMATHQARQFTGHLTNQQLELYARWNDESAHRALEVYAEKVPEGHPIHRGSPSGSPRITHDSTAQPTEKKPDEKPGT